MTKPTIKRNKRIRSFAFGLLSVFVFMLAILGNGALPKVAASTAKGKTFAQSLVEDTVAKHTELAGLELATTTSEGHNCITIAATDAKELGDKCDKGELKVIQTGTPTVEKENDGYDVTLPLHVSGKTIGFIGMDFKLDQQESGLIERATTIAKELEDKIPHRSKLFEAAK